MKNITDNAMLKIIFLTYLSFLLVGRGVFFLSLEHKALVDSEFYMAINSTISLTLVGLLPVVAGLLLLTTAFYNNAQSYGLFIFSNTIAVGVYYVFSKAGVNYGLNWWTGYTNALNLALHLILILWSVWILWQKKKTTIKD